MEKLPLRLLQPIRVIVIVSIALSFIFVGVFVLILYPNIWKRRRVASYLTHLFVTQALKVCRIRVTVKSDFDYQKFKGMTVGNHLSYLDIFVVSSVRPSSYITSLEMKRTPLLGQITDMGGCLYVDRRNRQNLRSEIGEISEALEREMNVTVFPEATSTNGEQVIRFRRALFNAAVMTGKPIMPMVINYREVDGEPMSRKYRDDVCWYGDMSMGGHLWRLMSHKRIECELRFLEPITEIEGRSAEDLANEAHAKVSAAYTPL